MGLLQSIFCTITFCVERVLTWVCCAVILIVLMGSVIVLMVYGISVGYHYAQKELATFAMSSRTSPSPSYRRSGADDRPVVRMTAVNKTDSNYAKAPIVEIYRTQEPGKTIVIETSQTPYVVLETQRPPQEPELSPHERELARKLIGRFRRSKNNTTPLSPLSSTNFYRPLRNNIDTITPLNLTTSV